MLQDDELGWKLAVDYGVEDDKFTLFINGRAFISLPYKASLATPVPQNIEVGIIALNGQQVHSGYKQYEESTTFYMWCYENDIETVTEAVIGGSRPS